MRKLFVFSVAALALLLSPLHARADDYSQTVTSASASAVSTQLSDLTWYSVQCDIAVRYRVCKTSTCTALTTDERIDTGAPFDILVPQGRYFIALIPSTGSGTSTCYVYLDLYQGRR